MTDPYAPVKKHAESSKEPLSKKEAAALYADLYVKSKKYSGKNRPSVDVMECLGLSGKTNHYIATGHHKFEDFAYACRYMFGASLHKVRHAYHREVWKTPPDGSAGKNYCTTELCKQHDKNAMPITIGYQ